MRKVFLLSLLGVAFPLNMLANDVDEGMKVVDFVTNHSYNKVSDSMIENFLKKEGILYTKSGVTYKLVLDNFNDRSGIVFQNGTDNFQGYVKTNDNKKYSQRLFNMFNKFKKTLLSNNYKFVKDGSVDSWNFDDRNDYLRCYGHHNSTKRYIFEKNNSKITLELANGSNRTCVRNNGSIDESSTSGSSFGLYVSKE